MPAMPHTDTGEITQLLGELRDPGCLDRDRVLGELVPLVYGDLKRLAKSNLYRWQGASGFGTTSLVHEAYARLSAHQASDAVGRSQFFALASSAMRTLLIDQARHQQRLKRGGGVDPLPLEEHLVTQDRASELLALEDALVDLERREPELARIVECRCFGGLTVEETAAALGVGTATVKRRWSFARSWLYRYLDPAQ